MKIKTPIKSESFCDGICDIQGAYVNLKDIHFGEKLVGAARFFAAAQAQTKISRLINIPLRVDISPNDTAVIGGCQYEIKQVQHIKDASPPITVLTLEQLEMFMGG